MKALFVSKTSDSGVSYALLLVTGKKTWELRKTKTEVRGRIGIVSKEGFLLGTVELEKVIGPFSAKELSRHKEHCSNFKRIKKYAQGKKLFAWAMQNAKKFKKPKKIKIKFKNKYDWIEA